jgi:glycosyltransferase involved in cell wall biosynthesis
VNEQWAQLWVHSAWVGDQARRGGVRADKIRVIPLGIDEAVYCPTATPRPLPTQRGFRFLFVGAPIYRKGVDVLLAAYRSAFTATDDAALVIKTNPKEIFYAGITLDDAVRADAARPGAPEVVLIDEHLSDAELAGLYRACSVGVFPYRAEGFCLPILEAMACGTPCIAPRFGACLDYCNDDTAFLMPVRRMCLPVSGRFAVNTLGVEADVSEVDFCEPAVDVLAAQMRAVYDADRIAVADTGRRAAAFVRARFTWSRSVDALTGEVRELLGRRP